MSPAVYRIRDLCALFACSTRTLDMYRRAPGFPRPMELPGRSVWNKQEVDDWIANRSTRLAALGLVKMHRKSA